MMRMLHFAGTLVAQVLLGVVLGVPGAARAEPRGLSGQVEIVIAGGAALGPEAVLLDWTTGLAGTVEVSGSVIEIPAGLLSAAVPAQGGFGGVLRNQAGTLSPGGAAPPSSCPLADDIACLVPGTGFGGTLRLTGLTQKGQPLTLGARLTVSASTAASDVRRLRAEAWTAGTAEAWYFVTEIDPSTPFLVEEQGSFPSIHGFSLVTPMVADSVLTGVSANDLRGTARLTVLLEPRVPGASPLLVGAALVLTGIGALRLLSPGTRGSRRLHGVE